VQSLLGHRDGRATIYLFTAGWEHRDRTRAHGPQARPAWCSAGGSRRFSPSGTQRRLGDTRSRAKNTSVAPWSRGVIVWTHAAQKMEHTKGPSAPIASYQPAGPSV